MTTIKLLRENNGFTQQALADKLGISKRSVENWDATGDLSKVASATLYKLAQLLDVDMEYLLEMNNYARYIIQEETITSTRNGSNYNFNYIVGSYTTYDEAKAKFEELKPNEMLSDEYVGSNYGTYTLTTLIFVLYEDEDLNYNRIRAFDTEYECYITR